MYNNQPIPQNVKGILKTAKIIHLALLSGQLMFAFVTISISKNPSFNMKSVNYPFFIVAPLLAVSCFLIGNFLFKKMVSNLQNKPALIDKLTGYQSALIVKCALLEGSSLFVIVVFMLTNNWFFLLISACIILYFITLRPGTEKVADDLQLNYDEKLELQG